MKIEFDTENVTQIVVDGKTYNITRFDYSIDPTYESVDIEWLHEFRHMKMSKDD